MRPVTAVILVPACLCAAACDADPAIPEDEIFNCFYEVSSPWSGWEWVLIPGDTARATVTAQRPTGEPVPNYDPEWESLNPTVVSVDSTGLLTARTAGNASVTARQCNTPFGIEVVALPTKLYLLGDSLIMVPGNHGWVPVSFTGGSPAGGEYWDSFFLVVDSLTWRSSSPGVARLEPAADQGVWWGGVEALEEGTASIAARLLGHEDSVSVRIARVELGPPIAGTGMMVALSPDTTVYCWPCMFTEIYADWGHVLGPAPVRMFRRGTRFVTLSGGGAGTCGLTAAGALYCGGEELENVVAPGTAFSAVSIGATHSCARAVHGEVSCWGWNDEGQLGVDSTGETCWAGGGTKDQPGYEVSCSTSPRPLEADPAFASVSAGMNLSCGLTSAGALYCWGHHYGAQPVQLGAGTWSTIALGGMLGQPFNCALDAEGGAWCWGSASAGLGDGATTESWTPVAVAGGHAFASVSVGNTACALTGGGDVYCWGGVHNEGEPAPGPVPVLVGGGVKFTSIAVGDAVACGYATDGDVWCWGSNLSGGLGVPGAGVPGGTDYAATPVKVMGQK